jgi:hypothetical protein
MSTQEFDDALEAPDTDAFQVRLSQIIANGVSAGAASPATAQAYLRTFCDRKFSFVRRRWVGLALCKMLQASADVVMHLERCTQGLNGIGDVILTTAELEETKVVAGLIIREGLARGVKFLSFWPSDKVQNSASNFPRDAGPNWMSEFQDFLETLAGLHITERVSDRDLFYIASVAASDGYQWKEPNDLASLLLIQREHLSIMTADPMLRNFRFVDIPLSHILSVRREKTALYDSQERQPKARAWDIIVKFRSGPWTYRVNSAEHSGHELSVIFIYENEAEECKSVILDLLRPLQMVASNDPISTDRMPDDVPEGGQTASIVQRGHPIRKDVREGEANGDGGVASQKETGFNAETLFQPSTATMISQQALVSRQISVPKASQLQKAEVEPSSEPPWSRSASSISLTGVDSTCNRREPSTITAQRQLDPSKTDSLPTIRKRASLSTNIGRLSYGPSDDEALNFLEQSPRIQRPSVAADRKPPAKETGRANALKESAKKITKVRPTRPKQTPRLQPQNEQINDTGDDEDPLNQSSLAAVSLQPHTYRRVQKAQGAKGGAAVPPSSLPKIVKPHDTQVVLSRLAEPGDIFAIPQDDEARTSKLRVKRKRAKPVTYKDLDVSEEETSGSEYREGKRKRTRSPAKQIHAAKVSRPKKGVGPSATNGMRRNLNTRTSGAQSQPINSAESSLISQLASKFQPVPGEQSKKSKVHSQAALNGKENVALTEKDVATPARLENPADFRSEMDILNKLNEAESNGDLGVNRNQASRHEKATVQQNRPLALPHPATPPCVERVELDLTSTKCDTEPHNAISAIPPSTMNAPLRVLAEPSSPCFKRDWRPSGHAVTESGHSMKAPAKPTVDHATHTATHSQHQRMFGPRKRIDARHTPLHQHGKRVHSGSSRNVELLSSNSKPTPASPHAESTAISGHADPQRVNMEREMGEYEISQNDPFTKRSNTQKLTSFTRRLTGDREPTFNEADVLAGVSLDLSTEMGADESSREAEFIDQRPKKLHNPVLVSKANKSSDEALRVTPAKRSRSPTLEPPESAAHKRARPAICMVMADAAWIGPRQPLDKTQMNITTQETELEIDGNTLLEQDSEPLPVRTESPILFKSSPPPLHGSPSSHSSTSAEDEPRTDPPFPTSEADNIEWEVSMQPHQRSLHEQLLRVSTRVVRHVVDNETAVDGIADTYARDGKHLLETLVKRHNGEYVTMFKDVEKGKENIKKSSELLLQRLEKDCQALDS